MTNEQYKQAKELFFQGKSLTQISSLLNIDRKKLSVKLKEDNLYEGKGYSKDQLGAAEILLSAGFGISDICKLFKTDKSRFSKALAEANIYDGKVLTGLGYDYNSDFCISIKNDYINGLKRSDILAKYDIHDGLLYRILKYHDVELDPSHIRMHTVNDDIFDVIDTEEKAYWLGFLYADGYVYNQTSYSLELTLAEKDKLHLEKFKSFIGSTSELEHKKVSINQKHFNAYRLTVCSKNISDALINLGCVQNKSLKLKFPTKVPYELINHFMRGYFDGDGSIGCYSNSLRFSVLGTKEFLDGYKEVLCKESNLNTDNKYEMNGKAFVLRFGGNIKVKKIYDFLYKDATIYLERKRDKFNLPS
jgi:hypothetical protein